MRQEASIALKTLPHPDLSSFHYSHHQSLKIYGDPFESRIPVIETSQGIGYVMEEGEITGWFEKDNRAQPFRLTPPEMLFGERARHQTATTLMEELDRHLNQLFNKADLQRWDQERLKNEANLSPIDTAPHRAKHGLRRLIVTAATLA